MTKSLIGSAVLPVDTKKPADPMRVSASDSLLDALCSLVEAQIAASDTDLKKQKWILSGNDKTLEETPDYESRVAFALARDGFRKSQPYQSLLEFIEQDSDFSIAPEKLGYWGTPEALIQRCLGESIRVEDGAVKLNSDTAKTMMARLRVVLKASEIAYEGRARLLGVKLSCACIPITSSISLVRLTKEEINERQADIKWSYSTVNGPSGLLDHHTEIRMAASIPVDKNAELAILNTQNIASSESRTISQNVLSAVRLFTNGRFEIGPTSTSSSILKGLSSSSIYTYYVSPHAAVEIGDSDGKELQRAYRIVSERTSDRVLGRGLNRFLLGRQRHDDLDKIVDYVIALESILLTVNEKSADTELSYRFRLNGSSLLKSSGVEPNAITSFDFMKGVYDVRSKIVHGAGDTEIQTALNKTNVESLTALAADLEEKLRLVIFWLSDLNVNDRPYKKKNGWEHLLWDNRTVSVDG